MNLRKVLADLREDGPEIKAVEEGQKYNFLIYLTFNETIIVYFQRIHGFFLYLKALLSMRFVLKQ